MKYHPALTRQNIEDQGPFKIAQMIASEFWQASQSAEFQADVMLNYHRARELMGVLETISLHSETAMKIAPFYRLCIAQKLFRVDRMRPFFIRHFAASVATAFERAAKELAHA